MFERLWVHIVTDDEEVRKKLTDVLGRKPYVTPLGKQLAGVWGDQENATEEQVSFEEVSLVVIHVEGIGQEALADVLVRYRKGDHIKNVFLLSTQHSMEGLMTRLRVGSPDFAMDVDMACKGDDWEHTLARVFSFTMLLRLSKPRRQDFHDAVVGSGVPFEGTDELRERLDLE